MEISDYQNIEEVVFTMNELKATINKILEGQKHEIGKYDEESNNFFECQERIDALSEASNYIDATLDELVYFE